MRADDEKLQQDIERGATASGNDVDARIYRAMFDTLGRPVADAVPYDMADVVIARVIARQRKRSVRDFVWLAIGVMALIIVSAAALLFGSFTVDLTTWRPLAGIGGLALFAVVFSIVLTVIDRKIVTSKLEI